MGELVERLNGKARAIMLADAAGIAVGAQGKRKLQF